MTSDPKLYVVVRADLPAGQQAVQAVHAAIAFAMQNKELFQGDSPLQNLALLAAPNERELCILIRKAEQAGIPWEGFQEEDLNNSVTAVAFAPAMRKLVSSLPKALRPYSTPTKDAPHGYVLVRYEP